MNCELRRLDEICLSITDCPHSTPKWTDEGICVIRSFNIRNGNLDLSNQSFTTEDCYNDRIKRAKPEPGDLIITREAPMGQVCMVPEDLTCCLGQRMVLLKVDRRVCNPYYLLYAIQSRYVQWQIMCSEGTGTTVSNLRIPHLAALKIGLPGMEVQNKIVSRIIYIEKQIQNNKKTNDYLSDLATLLFKETIVKNEIKIVTLSEVCLSIKDGVHNTVTDDPFGTCLLLSCKNIKNSSLIISDSERTIGKDVFDKLRKRTNIEPGDTLLTSVGTIGETYYVNSSLDHIEFQRSVAIIKPDSSKISPEYLHMAINYIHKQILNSTTGAVQQCLFLSDISNLEIPLVNEDIMKKLANKLSTIFDLKETLFKESQKLRSIRDILISQLIQ